MTPYSQIAKELTDNDTTHQNTTEGGQSDIAWTTCLKALSEHRVCMQTIWHGTQTTWAAV